MTYLSFLMIFVVLPALLLLIGIERRWASEWGGRPRRVFVPYIPAQAAIAFIYTTPWDNYLVAQGVWSYDSKRTLGWSIGWVPIEEYLFFILQPVLIGLWMEWIGNQNGVDSLRSSDLLWRWAGLAGCVVLGLGSAVLWREIGPPWTYTALITLWGLPPLMLQIAFGGDLLQSRGFAWLQAWLPPALYLSAADALAIRWGIWNIAPDQSMGWKVAGLPVEEILFFLLTSLLLANGYFLLASSKSRVRWAHWKERIRRPWGLGCHGLDRR